jgi:hypothetical protein
VRVHLAAEHALQLEPADVALETPRIVFDRLRRSLVILALGKLEQLGGVRDAFVGAIDLLELGREARTLLAELLRTFGGGPDGGILELAADLFQAFLFQVVLKETPVASSCARRGL